MNSVERSTFVVFVGAHSLLWGGGGGGWKEPHEVEREVNQLLGVKSVSYLCSGKHQSLSGLPSAEVKKF